jgi:hypothetical protein
MMFSRAHPPAERSCDVCLPGRFNEGLGSFKTVSSARIANPFNFEVELKNILLVALQGFEFSRSLGQKPKSAADAGHFRFALTNGHSRARSACLKGVQAV